MRGSRAWGNSYVQENAFRPRRRESAGVRYGFNGKDGCEEHKGRLLMSMCRFQTVRSKILWTVNERPANYAELIV